MKILSSLFVIFYSFLNLCNADLFDSNRCYANTSNPYLFMGSRTAYNNGRGNITRLPPESDCKPVQIWALIRHGATSMGNREYSKLQSLRDQIIENHEKREKGYLCREDLEKLRKWAPDNSLRPHELTPSGEKELRSLAKSLKNIFPELLNVNPQNISQKDYVFRSTKETRARNSMEAFMDGLFNNKDAVKPVETPKNDSLLHAMDHCPEWQKSLKNDDVRAETNKFMAGPVFKKLAIKMSKRLGFDHIIDVDTLASMYEVCRHEKSGRIDGESAWCAAFSDDDIRVFEYREDMGMYYMAGPGRTINEKLGCPPIKDLIYHFRNLEKENTTNSEPKAIFYFGHSINMATIAAAMDIAKDSPPPLAINYHLQKNRKFRTSFILPFSGNVIAVYYKCNGLHKVGLFVTERPVKLDGCINNNACDWELVKRKFVNTADQCNMAFCYESN